MKYSHSPTLHSVLDAVAGLEVKGTVDTAKEQSQRALGDEELSDYEQRYTVILQAGVEEEGKRRPRRVGAAAPRSRAKARTGSTGWEGTGKRRWPL